MNKSGYIMHNEYVKSRKWNKFNFIGYRIYDYTILFTLLFLDKLVLRQFCEIIVYIPIRTQFAHTSQVPFARHDTVVFPLVLYPFQHDMKAVSP